MSAELCSHDYGYRLFGYEEVYAGPEHELIYVGRVVKPGDEAFLLPGNWHPVAAKFFGMVITTQFKPVRRKRLWACKHKRLEGDNFCPVCMVFYRYVPEPW